MMLVFNMFLENRRKDFDYLFYILQIVSISFAIIGWISENFYIISAFYLIHPILLSYPFFNILFIFRYFLIWLIGAFTALTWLVFDGQILVAPFGAEFQTRHLTSNLVFANCLAVWACFNGWVYGAQRRFFQNQAIQKNPLPQRTKVFLKTFGPMFSIVFSLGYVWANGGFIQSGETYASNVRPNVNFAVFNVFHMIGVAFYIISSSAYESNKKHKFFFLITILSLMLPIFSGSRADYLFPFLFILFFEISRNNQYKIYSTAPKLPIFKIIFLFVFSYFIAAFVGMARSSRTIFESAQELIKFTFDRFVFDGYGHKIIQLENINMIISGFYGAMHNAQTNGLLLGSGYINWIYNLPPAFLGLPRIKGLEWFTSINGIKMSQGGIYEVAEAYWNFGYLGCLSLPFFVSWFMVSALSRGRRSENILWTTTFLCFGLLGYRAIFYQNFVYLRILTIMLCLAFFFFAFSRALVIKKRG